jgi:signal transduction histidine kinase/ActR/RegA family two-component response regulator
MAITDLHLGSRGRAAVIGGFASLLAGAGAFVTARTAADAERLAAQSLRVRQQQILLLSSVQDAEQGQRGYLLTDDSTYLVPFDDAEHQVPALEDGLRRLVADNPAQVERLAALKADIGRKMAELNRTVTLAKGGGTQGALAIVKTDLGRDLMVTIRSESARFDEAEAQLGAARQATVVERRSILLGLIVAALAAAAALAYLVWLETSRHTAQLAERNASLRREVVERQRAEAQLRQAQKMEALGQLTGGVAHDFNNMLAIIVGNLDMLIRAPIGEGARIRRHAESALTGAKRAASLTQRLLAFSRQQPLDPKPTDVNKCVKDMSEMLRRALGEQVSIETVLGGGVWHAYVDTPQLESAILNLAVNARDAMPGGGKLTIETSNTSLDKAYADGNHDVTPGQYVMVAITDSGAGMAPDIVEKAFDPFFTTKRLGEGTGLGLSQVHGFLKQSRGHVKLYSEPGVGTTVKLYIPRDASASVPAAIPGSPPAPAIAGRFTMLIVEDNDDVRNFAVAAATELGFIVIEAGSGAVALENLAAHPEIAVLLTDVVMPGMNGRELADAALAKRPDLRVIYMTGYTPNAIVHNGMLDKGTRLLTKPFTLDQLERELRDTLADAWPSERSA